MSFYSCFSSLGRDSLPFRPFMPLPPLPVSASEDETAEYVVLFRRNPDEDGTEVSVARRGESPVYQSMNVSLQSAPEEAPFGGLQRSQSSSAISGHFRVQENVLIINFTLQQCKNETLAPFAYVLYEQNL